MDPEPVYSRLRSRMKSLLSKKVLKGGKDETVCLEWKMSGERARIGGPTSTSYHSAGTAIKNDTSQWLSTLFRDSLIRAEWTSRPRSADNATQMVNSATITLDLGPLEDHLYIPVSLDRGAFLVGNLGESRLTLTRLSLGYSALDLALEDGVQFRYETEDAEECVAKRLVVTIAKEKLAYGGRHVGATFTDFFGSDLLEFTFELKRCNMGSCLDDELLELVKKDCALISGDVGGDVLRVVNTVRDNVNRRTEHGLDFALKCEGCEEEFRINKAVLAFWSPVFSLYFRHPDCKEVRDNRCVISGFSADTVKNFVLYCEAKIVPGFSKCYLEMVKFAHVYQVCPLLQLCELMMMYQVAAITLDDLSEAMPAFLKICEVASLYELPLLLVQLHFAVMKVDRTIFTQPQCSAQWQKFLVEFPDFIVNRYRALDNLKNGLSNEGSRKRKLQSD